MKGFSLKCLSFAGMMTLSAAVPAIAQDNLLTRQSDVFWSGQGRLEDTDDSYEHENLEYHYDIWSFTAEAGDQVSVSVESSDFDVMVILLSVSDEGTEIEAMNDDINDQTTNAQVDIDVTRSGQFMVGVLPYDPAEQGAYTIGVRDVTSAAVPSASDAPTQLDELNRLREQGAELNRVLLDIHEYPLF